MKKFLKITAVGMVVLIALLWFGGRRILSFSVADYAGELSLTGLQNPVEITFDARGIPQVWAETEGDMFFALGWLHASERLFQMELVRRVVAGELAELFGEEAYEVDVRQRRIGFARKAREDAPGLDSTSRKALQRYCDGVNAWIGYKTVLPPEFVILRFTPRPWQVEDCLGIAVYQTWYAHSLMDRELQFDTLATALGEVIKPLIHREKSWSPPTVPDSYLKTLFQHDAFPLRMSRASNSWVAAPAKSASGAALHASDPHLEVYRAPGFWYIAGLHSREGTNVLGVTAPGLPAVVMGHNGTIAYSFTVASIDLLDYFRYKWNSRDDLRILAENGSQPLAVIYEEIRVQGEEQPRREPIYFTPRGPVVEMDSASVIALKWAGYDFDAGAMVRSALKLHRAANFQEFREAVTAFGALDVNWMYSDAAGNIGYQLGAPIPKRNFSDAFVQLAGQDTVKQWQGYYPLEQTPHAFNPENGWLATCNNRVVSENWPYPVPGFYDPYRITRVEEWLSAKEQYSPEYFAQMQLDLVSGLALRWKGLMAEGAARLDRPDLAREIQDWSGEMAADNRTAALFALWWQFLGRAIFEDELGEKWETGRFLQEEVLTANLESVIDDRRTAERVETAPDLSAATLSEVLKVFGRKNYGEISKLAINHPLARVKILDFWLNLNRGPFPIGGDHGSPNANFRIWKAEKQTFFCGAGPSMRFILDWSDIDNFTIHTNLGQSGNPFSPHYDDHLTLMRTGKRWAVSFNRQRVYERKKSLLRLLPE